MSINSSKKPQVTFHTLNELRKILLANDQGLQIKIDQVIQRISLDFNSDVCSIYGFYNEGPHIIGSTWYSHRNKDMQQRLHIVAELLQKSASLKTSVQTFQKPSWPDIFLQPEIKKQKLNTFLSVPIIRYGHLIGAIVLTRKQVNPFLDGEIELLELGACLVGDLVELAQKRLQEKDCAREKEDVNGKSLKVFKGVLFSEGNFSYGRTLVYETDLQVCQSLRSFSVKEEIEEFQRAINTLSDSLDVLYTKWKNNKKKTLLEKGEKKSQDIFKTYKMLLKDPVWKEKVESYIKKNLTPAAAILKVYKDLKVEFSEVNKNDFSWVLEDINDLSKKLISILEKDQDNEKKTRIEEPIIIVAKNLGPGDFLNLNNYNIQGVILEEGGPSSHICLLAQSLNITVLGWVQNATNNIKNTDYIFIDNDKEIAVLNPEKALISEIKKKVPKNTGTSIFSTEDLHKACNKKGYKVFLNVGLSQDKSLLKQIHMDGVGLVRTEMFFMQKSNFPTIAEQEAYYVEFIKALKGKKCCIRTLDVGGDKKLPYMPFPLEENPVLGLRSIRMGLNRISILKHQLRALIRASEHGPVDITFPFISTAQEFLECKYIYEEELKALNLEYKPSIRLGIMIETPSIIYDLDRLKDEVEFLSVGTNDLSQFFFAYDRNNPYICYRYSNLSYSFLNFLKKLFEKSQEMNLEITICGNMASNKKEVQALAALGYTNFSVMPFRASLIQETLQGMDLKALKKKMTAFLQADKKENFSSSF